MSMKSLMILALLATGCSSGGGGGGEEASQDVTVVFGRLTAADGSAISGARVSGGGATARSDSEGRYELKAGVAARITVRIDAEGFLPAFRNTAVLDKKPVALDATLVAEAPAQPLDATMGGTVDGNRGARVVVPAGGLVSPMGMSVEGMVDVHLTPLDPGKPEELGATTDEFTGRTASGETTLLQSFGLLDITIRQDGETLQVAPGQTFEIRIPPPEGVTDPPATIPLWSLSEDTGTWVQEGEATFDAMAGVYVGQIGHMSTWNCDQPEQATCITGLVKDTEGAPLPGARITARGADYNGSSSAVALDDGRFYVAVRKDSDVSVLASHAAGGGTSRVVRSGTEDTTIPPTPGDPRCLDVGEWVVERGVVRTADGAVFNCDTSNFENPFVGTCAEGLFPLYQCFQPQGTCRYEGSVTESDVRWSNGVSMMTRYDGMVVNVEYRGTADQLCGTGQIAISQDGTSSDFEITLANGDTYAFLLDSDDTRYGIRCPSGEEVYFERADLEVLEACGVASEEGSESSISQCEGYPAPGGGGAGGSGGQPTLCMQDSECMVEGEVCCRPDPNNTQGVCLERSICDQIQMNNP